MGEPGSSPPADAAALARGVAELEEAAGRLRGGELSPEAAAELVEWCAQAAARASAELERLARAAASEPSAISPVRDTTL
jgi:CRISPR/Cas system-associated protein Csm6